MTRKFEVEIKRVSFITYEVEADSEDEARDKAMSAYEDSTYTDNATAYIEYSRELT